MDKDLLVERMESGEFLEKVELIKAMDLIVGFMNNAEGEDLWLMEGPGDGAGAEEYSYAACDDDVFQSCCNAFYQIVKWYGEDGWYSCNWQLPKK